MDTHNLDRESSKIPEYLAVSFESQWIYQPLDRHIRLNAVELQENLNKIPKFGRYSKGAHIRKRMYSKRANDNITSNDAVVKRMTLLKQKVFTAAVCNSRFNHMGLSYMQAMPHIPLSTMTNHQKKKQGVQSDLSLPQDDQREVKIEENIVNESLGSPTEQQNDTISLELNDVDNQSSAMNNQQNDPKLIENNSSIPVQSRIEVLNSFYVHSQDNYNDLPFPHSPILMTPSAWKQSISTYKDPIRSNISSNNHTNDSKAIMKYRNIKQLLCLMKIISFARYANEELRLYKRQKRIQDDENKQRLILIKRFSDIFVKLLYYIKRYFKRKRIMQRIGLKFIRNRNILNYIRRKAILVRQKHMRIIQTMLQSTKKFSLLCRIRYMLIRRVKRIQLMFRCYRICTTSRLHALYLKYTRRRDCKVFLTSLKYRHCLSIIEPIIKQSIHLILIKLRYQHKKHRSDYINYIRNNQLTFRMVDIQMVKDFLVIDEDHQEPLASLDRISCRQIVSTDNHQQLKSIPQIVNSCQSNNLDCLTIFTNPLLSTEFTKISHEIKTILSDQLTHKQRKHQYTKRQTDQIMKPSLIESQQMKSNVTKQSLSNQPINQKFTDPIKDLRTGLITIQDYLIKQDFNRVNKSTRFALESDENDDKNDHTQTSSNNLKRISMVPNQPSKTKRSFSYVNNSRIIHS